MGIPFNYVGPVASVTVTPSTGTMTLATAREWVKRSVRESGDTSAYSTADLDRAIIYAGQYFCRETKCVRAVSTISITEGDDSPDISDATDNGFIPERRIDAILDGEEEPLKFIDYGEINRMAAQSTSTGVPCYVAFLDATTIKLYPEPDAAYSLYLRYWQPFTSIVPGSTSAFTTLNIPEEHLPFVLQDGAAAVLLKPSGERLEKSQLWADFKANVARLTGANALGSRLVQRQLPCEDTTFRRWVTDPDLA